MTMAASTAHRPHSYLSLTLLVGAVQMIVTMDIVTMGVLLSPISRDFDVGPVLLSGLLSFSSLVFASMMLIGGRLSDLIGQRRCIVTGLAIAALGALMAGLAPHFAVLIGGRLLFGLGAAIMIPANFSIINTVIPEGSARHRAYGVYGMVQGIALFVGPGLGGLLATHFGWRSVFFANALFMVALFCLSLLALPKNRSITKQRFDFIGSFLFVPGIIALVLAISGGSGLLVAFPLRLGVGLGGLLFLGLFVRSQAKAASPLLPLEVLNHPGVKSGMVSMMLMMASSAGLFVLPSLVMQQAMSWSPAQSGFGMLPHALSVILTGQLIGWFLGRFPAQRNVLIGYAILMAGLFLNSFMRPDHGYLTNVMIPMMLGASGSIFLVIMLTAVITLPLPAHQQGVISAVTFTSQQIGISLGSVALLSVAARGEDPFTALNHAFLAAAAIALCGLLLVLKRGLESQPPSVPMPQI